MNETFNDQPVISKYHKMAIGATVATSFLWGFYNGIKGKNNEEKSKEILEKPLGTTFCSTIIGSFYAVGGSFITFILPYPYLIAAPVIIGSSLVNTLFKN